MNRIPVLCPLLLALAMATSAGCLPAPNDDPLDDDELASTPDLAWCTVTTRMDDPADGRVDSIQVEELNGWGLVHHIDWDDDADDLVDATLDASYDDFGQLTWEEGDEDMDGQSDWATEYSWDLRGNLVRVAQVGDGSGHGGVTVHSYDDEDRLETTEWDFDADGVHDYLWENTRDEEGLLVRRELWHLEEQELGQVWTYLNDERGRLLTTWSDAQADGSYESIEHQQWDEQDRRVQKQTDYYGDGTVDNTSIFTYDDEGRLLLEQFHRGEATVPLTYSFASTWDERGLLVRHETTWHEHSDSPRKIQTIERQCPSTP